MPTIFELQQRNKAHMSCVGCGESKRFAHLNINGECEDCSVICDSCEEPSRIVGLLNDEGVCADCEEEVRNEILKQGE